MGFSQALTGLIEPNDQAFRLASIEDRRWFYRVGGDVALDRLKTQLLRGIGRNGRLFKPRIQAVLPGGWDGPAMSPRYDASRDITLSDYMATDRSLTIFWHAGTGHSEYRAAKRKHKSGTGGKPSPFGDILSYHADGLVRGAPVRDVRLSAASIAQIKSEMARRWSDYVAARTPVPAPAPRPRPQLPAVPAIPAGVPPPIAATGRTDTGNFTFGIGGGKGLADRAIASGHFTGFRKPVPHPPGPPGGVPLPTHLPFVPPGTGNVPAPHAVPLPQYARPPTLPGQAVPVQHAPLPIRGGAPHAVPLHPAPATPSSSGAAPTLAAVEQKTGLRFVPAVQSQGKETVVIADVAKLEAALAGDAPYHVGPAGVGAGKPGAYETAKGFMDQARASGTPLEMPRVGLTPGGDPAVIDGRHRLAVLRDANVRFVPVTVPRAAAERFRQLFGA